MIDFDSNGNGIVSWDIPCSGGSERSKVTLTLEEWLALTKVTSTLEELRATTFMFITRQQELGQTTKNIRKETKELARAVALAATV